MFEPCGLTQLVAMRYGAIPIVRKTGGMCRNSSPLFSIAIKLHCTLHRIKVSTRPDLSCFSGLYDTVFDVDTDKERAQARGLEPNGFSFDGADSRGVDYALNRQAQSRRAWFTELWQLFTHRSCLMLHLQGGLCLV